MRSLSPLQRLKLIRRIGDWLYRTTESWGQYNLGTEIAHLLLAITNNHQIQVVRGKSALLDALENVEDLACDQAPIEPEDVIWEFIVVTDGS